MALQFASFIDLHTDLTGKPGIESAQSTLPSPVAENFYSYVYDLPVIRFEIEQDGSNRYFYVLQQIIEEKEGGVAQGDGRFGYGINKRWGLTDRSPTPFQADLEATIANAIGNSITYEKSGADATETIRNILIEDLDRERDHAIVNVYTENGGDMFVHQRAAWHDDTNTVQHRQVFQT